MTSNNKLADWIFDGCTYYHIENIGKENERIYCDFRYNLEYGNLLQCTECRDRKREHHYYG